MTEHMQWDGNDIYFTVVLSIMIHNREWLWYWFPFCFYFRTGEIFEPVWFREISFFSSRCNLHTPHTPHSYIAISKYKLMLFWVKMMESSSVSQSVFCFSQNLTQKSLSVFLLRRFITPLLLAKFLLWIPYYPGSASFSLPGPHASLPLISVLFVCVSSVQLPLN